MSAKCQQRKSQIPGFVFCSLISEPALSSLSSLRLLQFSDASCEAGNPVWSRFTVVRGASVGGDVRAE